ncbi:MAG: RNA polymerase sigma factor [Armatimonadetes bacterium]|nr:RNA polymerase sigma factor [Armatimonadota bacterium]
MDDDALMRQVAAGDAQAFERLVRTYQPRLLRFAMRLLGGDADAAQDAALEALLRLWRVRERWRPCGGSLEGFLLRAVRNICLDHARAAHPTERLQGEVPQGGDDPAEQSQKQALAEAIREAVRTLSEPQRTVFILSQYEGLSYAEIAAILECPVGTVASRKHLATETLRRRLWAWREEGNDD